MALSDAWLKANLNKSRPTLEEFGDRDGLGVRVTPKGKIVFQLRYRYDRKHKRVDLGSYPGLSLKAARDEGQRLKARLEQGNDPRVVRVLEKRAIIEAATIQSLFQLWYDGYCVPNKKRHLKIKRKFEIHVLPGLGSLPADKVTLHEWLALLEGMAVTQAPTAGHLLTNCKQMLKWGVKRRLVTSNPLADIRHAEDLLIRPNVRTRALSDDEIPYALRAIEKSQMAQKNKVFVKLCLIYACRYSELRLAEKTHLNFSANVWTVPPENHKMGKRSKKPLLRPIVPETEALWKEAIALAGDGRFLFSKPGVDEAMSEEAARRMPYAMMKWLRRNEDYDMAHWSMHDMRRTARTNFSTITEPHIAEIMLGHKLPGTWQVYDKHDYLPEQAAAYSAWANRIEALASTAISPR